MACGSDTAIQRQPSDSFANCLSGKALCHELWSVTSAKAMKQVLKSLERRQQQELNSHLRTCLSL